MTKRELIASQIMQGLVGNEALGGEIGERVETQEEAAALFASIAILYTDTLLHQLGRGRKKQ